MSYFTDEVTDTNPYGYEIYKLPDGSELMFSREDRVLFHRTTATSMPLTIDPESVFDDVLGSLRQAQNEIEQVVEDNKRLRDVLAWYADTSLYVTGDYEGGVFFSHAERDNGKKARSELKGYATL